MKKELLNKEVLALYDARGIQSYVFKTNAAKEIIGASVIVDNIIVNGLKAYVERINEDSKENYILDWEDDDADAGAFEKNKDVKMQVLFVGGGNAYVLFRSGEICQKVNRFLGKYVLDKSYSLKLAISVVEKTDSYNHDYQAINLEMQNIKVKMPMSLPLGALPFMDVDTITGYPLCKKDAGDYYSKEAYLKRVAFNYAKDASEKVFDNMVTEKKSDSTLAVFHIDGNRMGIKIKKEMENIENYTEAVATMRRLSKDITESFREIVDEMTKYMNTNSSSFKTKNAHYREIIVAGDDITFVCNAKLAIPAVTYFLRNIGNKGYSACGGIAYFNSHFPFSDAYKVAEACCDSAKKFAKSKENLGENDEVGNYFDFQICNTVSAANLDAYREKHYLVDGELFIQRPYCVKGANGKLNEDKLFHYNKLQFWSKKYVGMSRNKVKDLRTAISGGEVSRNEMVSLLASRNITCFKEHPKEYKVWYDALELMDWFMEEKGEKICISK